MGPEGIDRVVEERGDGHRSDSSRNGRDGSGDFPDLIEEHISLQFSIRSPRDSDIDDDRPRLDEVPSDHFGFSESRDKDIGLSCHVGKIGCVAVADGHRSIPVEKEQGHRLPDDQTTSDHHGMFARDREIEAVHEGDDSPRSAGDESWLSGNEPSQIYGMKSVDILVGGDPEKNLFLWNVGGKRKLDKDAIDGGVVVELVDGLKDRIEGCVRGQVDVGSIDSHPVAGLPFVGHIGMASRIVSDENYRKSWGTPGLL